MDKEHKWRTEVRATCTCGWRSENTHNGANPGENDRAAMIDFAAHARACDPKRKP